MAMLNNQMVLGFQAITFYWELFGFMSFFVFKDTFGIEVTMTITMMMVMMMMMIIRIVWRLVWMVEKDHVVILAGP